MTTLLLGQGRKADAEAVYRELVEARAGHLAPDDVRLIAARVDLGANMCLHGDRGAGEALLEDAIAVAAEARANAKEGMERPLRRAARVLVDGWIKSGQVVKAAELAGRAVVWAEGLPPTNRELRLALRHQVRAMLAAGDTAGATAVVEATAKKFGDAGEGLVELLRGELAK